MRLQKQLRGRFRGPGKYARAVMRWKRLKFDEAPTIFGNGKPKSGSHLLLQVLNGLCQLAPYAYVAAHPIRTIRKEGGRRTGDEILSDLRAVPQGVIGWGYLEPTEQNLAFLCQPGRVNYFIYRDPRDVLVSQVFFATKMHTGHGMHEYYNSLPDFSERLKVAITGIDRDGLNMVSVAQRYASVFDWLEVPTVTSLRFEDLIDNREAALSRILDAIEDTGYRIPTPRHKAIEMLVKAIQPRKSHTFRSGKTGGWEEHFSGDHKKLFKEVAGDLLVKLGYEENNDW